MNSKQNLVEGIRLLATRKISVKDLAGYKKHHRVSDDLTESDMRFASELAIEDMKNDLDSVYSDLRSEFGLKRKQLVVSDPGDGFGAIETPFLTMKSRLRRKSLAKADCVGFGQSRGYEIRELFFHNHLLASSNEVFPRWNCPWRARWTLRLLWIMLKSSIPTRFRLTMSES